MHFAILIASVILRMASNFAVFFLHGDLAKAARSVANVSSGQGFNIPDSYFRAEL